MASRQNPIKNTLRKIAGESLSLDLEEKPQVFAFNFHGVYFSPLFVSLNSFLFLYRNILI